MAMLVTVTAMQCVVKPDSFYVVENYLHLQLELSCLQPSFFKSKIDSNLLDVMSAIFSVVLCIND